jgi:hypothetical protein
MDLTLGHTKWVKSSQFQSDWNSDIILQWLRPNSIKRTRAGQGRTSVNRRVMGLAPLFLSHCQTKYYPWLEEMFTGNKKG